jgi:hypothetical protein
LLDRQRGNWNQGEIFHQPVMNPNKMFEAPRYFDAIELKRNGRIFSYIEE